MSSLTCGSFELGKDTEGRPVTWDVQRAPGISSTTSVQAMGGSSVPGRAPREMHMFIIEQFSLSSRVGRLADQLAAAANLVLKGGGCKQPGQLYSGRSRMQDFVCWDLLLGAPGHCSSKSAGDPSAGSHHCGHN